MTKHDIPNGWVSLRDPKAVPERLRRPLMVMSVKGVNLAESGEVNMDSPEDSKMSAETLEFFSEWNDKLAIALIAEWSFDVPVNEDNLLDLPGVTYDAIRKLVAPMVSELMPSFSPDPDPKADTENSAG